METWAYDDPQLDSRAQQVVDYLEKQTKNSELAENAGKLWDLYLFLNGRTFQSPAEIQSSVFLDSKHTQPLFSDSETTKVFELLQKKGGAIEGESPEAADNIVLRWIGFVREWSPAFVTDTADTIAPYVFILKGLEENPEFGALLAIALDSVEAGLKSTAAVIQNSAPVIVGLLPIPEAGPVGAVLGWLVASVFIFLLVAIHISRKQFGQAFIASFGLIPVVGESLYNVAMSGEKFLQKTSERRDRLIGSVRNVAGDYAADTLDALVPDPLAVPDPNAPGFTDILQKMQDDARAKLQSLNIDSLKGQALEKVQGLQGQALEKVQGYKTQALAKAQDLKQKAVSSVVDEAKRQVREQTIGRVQNLQQQAIDKTRQIRDKMNFMKKGGIRFSRRRRVKSKWRTQRRK